MGPKGWSKSGPRAYSGKTLKVLLFNESLTGGGCERNLVELATHFDPRVVSAQVLIYHKDLHYVPQLEAAGIPWYLIEKKGKFDFGFYVRLIAFLRRERFDVIHSFLPTPNFWMKLARIPAGLPPLVIFLGSINPGPRDFLLDRIFSQLVSQVIVNSSTAGREAVERFLIPEEQVHLIYNGVDLEAFAPGEPKAEIRQSLGVPPEDFLLTVVARVRGEKNHRCLVKALIDLKKAGELPENFHARFVGRRADETLIAELDALLEGAGLGERVTFVGPRADIPEVLRASNCLVLPSLYEGCPNAVQEAMACGLPVIASRVSDNPILIEEGVTGFLFENDKSEDLAAQLRRLFSLTSGAREAMGEAGRRRISSYDMAAYLKATHGVYRRALEG